MASVFAKMGYEVICFGTKQMPAEKGIYRTDSVQNALSDASVIVCGIPFEKAGFLYFEEEISPVSLTELQRLLRKHHKIFGGVIPETFKRMCEKRSIGCFDFMAEEGMTIFNAVATAEGAVLEALAHKDTQLHQGKVLILGYGRCGRVLSDKLKGLSALVTVCTASAQEQAYAAALGFQTLSLSQLAEEIGEYEYIFNTIPATVLDKACLERTIPDVLLIDIASNRIGADYEAAAVLQRNLLFCPGLPGKYASRSCAEKLAEFVLKEIQKGPIQ